MADLKNSALIEYGSAVVDGRITACDKIRRVYEQRLEAVQKPGKYHFDLDLAQPHIDFASSLPVKRVRRLFWSLFRGQSLRSYSALLMMMI